MSGWSVGDLALCVDASAHHQFGSGGLVEGATYTVAGINWGACSHYGWACGLHFRELNNPLPGGFYSGRFRKIGPDKHESCEPEFVQLLKRSKVTA